MRFSAFRRGLGLATATAFAIVGLGVAAPASAASNACPGSNSLDNFVLDSNVSAWFTSTTVGSTTTFTYKFASIVSESPVNGVPGLVAYCVYTNPAPGSVTVNVPLLGADGEQWVESGKSKAFAFVRPSGAKSNIPLDGVISTMGTAAFTTPDPTQTILVHIDDPAVCSALYGTALTTCFVKPVNVDLDLPVCNAGATDPGYNAIPTGSIHCAPPSLGFEATSTNEFGDQVVLDPPTGTIKSLMVQFQSYGCSVSGHWNTGDCLTSGGATTFTHDITANLYDPSDLTTPIATTTLLGATIPFRPDADPVNCPGTDPDNSGADGSRWFDSVSGECHYSIAQQLTFNLFHLHNVAGFAFGWREVQQFQQVGFV